MKKTFRFLLAAVCLLGIASCADVPELPYPVPDPNGGGGGGKTTSGLPFTSASLNNFEVKTIEGIDWSLGSSYAKASGYDNNTKSTTATRTWLVSPAINTTVTGTSADGSNTDGIIISFDHVLRYVKSSTDVKGWHKVLASKDYAGDVTTATWIDLNFQPVESSTNDWTFYAANPVVLPAELWNEEKVYIAFYFQCDATNSTTWELKNLTVKEGMTPDPLPGPTPGDGKLPFAQEFSNDFGSFVPVDVNGPDSWVIDFKTAKMTGYDGTNRNANEDWLISCPIDLSDVSSAKLIMNYIYRYKVSDEDITVWASKSFNGSSITPSDWTQVKGNQLVEGKDWNTFSNTEFDLTPFVGDKIYVAVKYVSVAGSASTIEIKKITIEEGQANVDGNVTPTPTDVTPVTIAGFNAAPVSTSVWYELTGVASGIKSGDQYGNFDLTDETGKVYVYGLLAEKGGAGKAFQDLVAKTGLANGDKIRIHGQRGDYNGKIEVLNAYLVEIVQKGDDTPGPGPTPGGEGDGSESSPYNVAYVRSAGNPGSTAWVKGYIVGTVKDGGKTYSEAVFGLESASNTNILLADAADCADASLCIPVQLPNGSVREALSLQQHPENLGKQVALCGTLEKYFGEPGVKNTSKYSWDDNGGGVGPDPTPGDALFSADFTKGENGFKAYDVELGTLNYVWAVDTRYGWKASAYKDNANVASESWLVSPVIDLTSASAATLTFSHTANYLNGAACTDYLSVLVSTNFGG